MPNDNHTDFRLSGNGIGNCPIIIATILFLLVRSGFSQDCQMISSHLQDDFPEMEPWVQSIAQDRLGFMWFGGGGSIQKFDGYRFQTYPFFKLFDPSEKFNQVFMTTGFLTDSYENFWVFINDGLFIYNHDFDRFTRIDFELHSAFSLQGESERAIITAIREDNKKNLWVGTKNGLVFYISLDSIQKPFIKDDFPPDKLHLLSNNLIPVKYLTEQQDKSRTGSNKLAEYVYKNCNEILEILQDRDGDIWLDTRCGVMRLVYRNHTWVDAGIYFVNKKPEVTWEKSLFLDNKKNIWFGIGNNVACKKDKDFVSPNSGTPQSIQSLTIPIPDSSKNGSDFYLEWHTLPQVDEYYGLGSWIKNVVVDGKNQLFVFNGSSLDNYTLEWDSGQKPVFVKKHGFSKADGITTWKARLSCMYYSREGILFASDISYGIITCNLNHHSMFRKLNHVTYDKNSLPADSYSSMVDLGNNHLLFGAIGSIYQTDYSFSSFKKYSCESLFKRTSDNFIMEMIHDGFGNIWIRNMEGEMAVLNEGCFSASANHDGCSRKINLMNFGLKGSSSVPVFDMEIDKNKVLWLSTGIGLYYYSLSESVSSRGFQGMVFKKFNDIIAEDSVQFKHIQYMVPVREDFYLMVSEEGWLQFDPLNRKYWRLNNEQNYGVGKPALGFWVFDVDGSGNIWATDLTNIARITFTKSTLEGPATSNVKVFSTSEGFPERPFEFITDDHNNLWLYPDSRNPRLIRYNPGSHDFTEFKGPGIIKGGVFGLLKDRDLSGKLYLGAMDGITVFHPDSIQLNPFEGSTQITDIKVLNKSILSNFDSTHMVKHNDQRTLRLNPNESVFEVEFASLSFSNSSANRYAHFLKNFDRDTIYTDASKRTASYSNLDPGRYEFYVKGSNDNGVWDKDWATLSVVVLPYWYETPFAYISYLLIFVGLIVWWRYYDLRRIKLRHTIELEHAEAEKFKELDRLKTEFFSNISHEFRTPITVILGLLENLIREKPDAGIHKEAEIMKRNLMRLLQLINQILDLSKLDAGKMRLHAAEINIVGYLKETVANFESIATIKGIELTTFLPKVPVMVYLDPAKMQEVIENLVSNALKFTDADGKVIIRLNEIPNPQD